MNIDRRQLLGSAAALAGASALGPPAFAADPIKVGSLHDLSGGLDIYGKPMVDALTLAIEEANAAGGLLGVFWGIMYLRRGSVIAPMVSHSGFNLIELVQYLAFAGRRI